MSEQKASICGFLLINKPQDYSSYDCIRVIKKIIKNKQIKIGHTGTLDNFAQGLLIIAIGKATKKISLFMNLDKTYIATGKLEELTDTLDLTGNVVSKSEKTFNVREIATSQDKLSKEIFNVNDVVNSFAGKYCQTPPIYSALKYKGESLYKLTREKKISEEQLKHIIETKKRTINIYKIDLLEYNHPFFKIKTHVSKGTYIRSLVNDIAEKLNTHATCYDLIRTKIGTIDVKNTINLLDLKTIDDINNNLIPIEILENKLKNDLSPNNLPNKTNI